MNSSGFAASLSLCRASCQTGRITFAFAVSLLLSLALHVIAPASVLIFLPPERSAHVSPPIRARLDIMPLPVESVEPDLPAEADFAQNLRLKQPPPRPAPPPPLPPPEPDRPLARLAAAASQQLAAMDQAGDFYPVEAIEQRLEGDVLVRIFFDEDGEVIAARLEESSGHPLLDAAALRAVRSLQSLEAYGLESVNLPVRFRLRKIP
ncbi:MAG: energy transducer TonB [Betaproteobacteria bacterium]|nr:energy transducer TonB [Betaproteobacteria bacterium]